MTEIQRISIELFDPNPYQPETRIQVTDQVAEQYGKSILQHGLLQTPLARVSPKSKTRKDLRGDYRYEMGDGWLRLTGFRWLVKNGHPDFKTIPCEVRDLSDEQMAHLVFEANGVRKDLNPIETATYFQKYLSDFGVTEGKLAEIHGLSQGEVANTIRLLQLPKDVQYLVGQGTLSQTHARHLLRLNKVPELQAKAVKAVIKDNIPVSRLANDVEVELWQHSKSLNAKSEESYNRPTFDVETCKGCEHTVEASYPYGNRKKELRCLNPECWDKKEAAAVAVKVKEAKAELEKDFKGQKVFTNKDLSYNQREDLSEYTLKLLDNPGECKKCDKVVLYKYDLKAAGKPEKVCTNPQCMRQKKAKKTRDENKIRSGEDKALTAKLAQAFVHAPSPRSAMLIYARHHIPGISAAAKEDLAVLVPGLPKLANGHLNMDKLMVQVEEKPLDELLKLVVAAEFCQVRRQHSYEKFNTKLTAELKKDLATIEGTLEKHVEELKVWQEANCRGCSNAKDVLVGSGLECCEYTYNKKILDDGTCERGKAHKAKTESKRASVVNEEASSEEKPTDSTPRSEREVVKGIPADTPAARAIHAIHAIHTNDKKALERELAGVPDGVRLVEEVPDEECKKCAL
ncbi:MAG: ParB/RepB/Spo0J family partition protein, partial [Dehalococcoidales bacterium]|nr:ParB/RepB/Spo0J family partition protein [Dehalococcoidales bacterium]